MGYIESLFGVSAESLTADVLKNFILAHPEENLHLEFKGNQYFDKKKETDLTIAVSSFANSDGGILILGVKEKKQNDRSYADDVDGIPPDRAHSKESLENILISKISPRIEGLRVYKIQLDGKNIFLLEVPKSDMAPHMAADHRYYKRFNFQKLPMEHYEIIDYLGRRRAPRLTVKFVFSEARVQNKTFACSVEIMVGNLGKIMAKYVIMVLQIAGIGTVKPLSDKFRNIGTDQNGAFLQYGPWVSPSAPTVFPPSSDKNVRWTTLGKLSLLNYSDKYGSSPDVPQLVISYSAMHEEMPETEGGFSINLIGIKSLMEGGSYEIRAENEHFVH